MKNLAAITMLLALGANAHTFRAEAPITPAGKDVFQRLELPLEAYRDTRRDLGDIRVLNSRGEEVPIAFAMEAEGEKSKPESTRLPQFEITAHTGPVVATGRLDVQVRSDGTVISVQGRPTGKGAAPRPVAFLLDASLIKYAINALWFDWEANPGAEIVKVSVESSDDLRDWRNVASRSPLVRVQQGGQSLSQTRVALGGVRAKYFRITWDGGVFPLRSVEAESAPSVKPLERHALGVKGTRSKEGDLVFDLGARLPVEAVRVLFPETNSVVPFELAMRDGRDAPWRTVSSGTFYRLTRDGVELTSPPLEIGSHAAREWRLKSQVKSGSDGSLPSLEVLWRPAEVVFVAKGEPPFTLAFGDPEARSSAIPVSSLIPGYEKRGEHQLPLASTGEIRVMRGESLLQGYFGDVSPKKVALWAVLVLAVAVLGFMAWRMSKQMRS